MNDLNKTVQVVELTFEECKAIFDENCRSQLGISGDEFLRRYPDDLKEFESSDVFDIEMLLPFGRAD